MAKKKKGKSQKYAKLGEKDSTQTPRRSKRTRHHQSLGASNDAQFRQEVQDGPRSIVDIEADGNCLFGAISDQLYHDSGNLHAEIRHQVCDYIEAMREEFENFVMMEEDDEDVADFDSYVQNMRQDAEWGGNVELVAASRLYRRNIVVFSTEHAFTIEHGQEESGGPDMMLSYHGSEHYNSVRDDNVGKPPPPSKISLEKYSPPLTLIESEGDETEAILETNHNEHAMDHVEKETLDNVESAPSLPATTTKPRIKKNNLCPCGSGRKYKKCCFESDKSKERAKQWKAKHGESSEDSTMETVGDKDEEVSVSIDGNFRVLKI